MNADQRGGTGPNGKRSLTVEEAAANLLRDGLSWTTGGAPLEITYAFRASAAASMPPGAGQFSRVNDQQMDAIEDALQQWANVANITFVHVSDAGSEFSNNATMLFGNYAGGLSDFSAYAYLPGDRAAGSPAGDVWIDDTYVENVSVTTGYYGYLTLVHEIGHALGLQHPSYYIGSEVTYARDADYYEDSNQFTVMSYFDITETGGRAGDSNYYPESPLLDDIAAIQQLYGANPDYLSGNTVYGNFYGGDAQSEYPANHLRSGAGVYGVYGTVYDTAGTDLFDFSLAETAQVIDLRAGNFSDVHGDVGTLSIALGTVIENAIGGYARDEIIGNAAANHLDGRDGDDTLSGGGGGDVLAGGDGDDVLTGGAGRDVFEFGSLDAGRDRITDFAMTTDRIDLFGNRFTGIATSGSALIATHAGGSVTFDGLGGTTLAALNGRLVPSTPLVEPIPPSYFLSAADGFAGSISGSGLVFGTAGGQQISLLESAGYVSFDASFNRGGDLIYVPDVSSAFTVLRSGSSAQISDGETTLIVPIGYTATTIQFDDALLGLRADPTTGAVMLGDQIVTTQPTAITSGWAFFDFPRPDHEASARLRLVEDVSLTVQGRFTVFGNDGDESVTLLPYSSADFDASFNAGGDRIVLSGAMAEFDVLRSGSSAVFENVDREYSGETFVVPVGVAGAVIAFDDGEAVLRFDTVTGQVLFGAQVIGTTAAEVSGAPIESVGDVVPPMMAAAAFDALPGDYATFAL
ncbi:M10 family metallopeptidase [Sphingomonas japonica]|uniref:Ca2+-binding RTX toxin-like protein n=1 Tax=Sphingomonas japonica TaxID=511662 RepID=A0ABX0U510_9SPHN|nr:M10 family metallopeptidase [Sphingomonas japonica]NIJ24357.1 Ca2+-binding RTX toxin-like protein [Sphingomonas japonica]